MFGTKAHLTAHDDHLFIEDVDSVDLANDFGTPLYVTSEARLRQNIRAYHSAFPDADKYFAVKANGNLTVLRILAQEGRGRVEHILDAAISTPHERNARRGRHSAVEKEGGNRNH